MVKQCGFAQYSSSRKWPLFSYGHKFPLSYHQETRIDAEAFYGDLVKSRYSRFSQKFLFQYKQGLFRDAKMEARHRSCREAFLCLKTRNRWLCLAG